MKKLLLTMMFVVTFFTVSAISASAVVDDTVKVGLRYGSSVMDSANLENAQGQGYAFEAAHAFFDYLFSQKGARRIYAYTEDYNLSSQHLCEKLGMRREGVFLEFISFVNNPDGTPRYENTVQYAILKKEWDRQQSQ